MWLLRWANKKITAYEQKNQYDVIKDCHNVLQTTAPIISEFVLTKIGKNYSKEIKRSLSSAQLTKYAHELDNIKQHPIDYFDISVESGMELIRKYEYYYSIKRVTSIQS